MEVTTTYNHRFRPNSCIPDLIRDHHSLSLDGIGQVTIHLQRLSSFSSCCLSARINSHNISVHRRYCSWRHESGCRGSLRVCFNAIMSRRHHAGNVHFSAIDRGRLRLCQDRHLCSDQTQSQDPLWLGTGNCVILTSGSLGIPRYLNNHRGRS